MGFQEEINTGIKRLRKRTMLTQEQFAEQANISIDKIKTIEQNRNAPTAKTIDAICEAYNTRLIDLFMPEQTKDRTEVIQTINKKLESFNLEELCSINDTISSLIKYFTLK